MVTLIIDSLQKDIKRPLLVNLQKAKSLYISANVKT